MEFLRRLWNSLTDSRWQGIGAVVGLLGLLVAIYSAFNWAHNQRVIVVATGERYSLKSNKGVLPEITYQVDGATVKRLVICNTSLTYRGDSAILESDTVEPLQVRCKDPYSIVGIYPAESSLKSEWVKINAQEWRLKPTLFNPKDVYEFLIFVCESNGSSDTKKADSDWTRDIDFNWTFRAANVAPLEFRTLSFHTEPKFGGLMFISAMGFFVFTDYGLLLYVCMLLTFLTVSCSILMRQPRTKFVTIVAFTQIVLSFLAAESISWFVVGKTTLGINPACYVFVILYFLSTSILYSRMKRKVRRRLQNLESKVEKLQDKRN